MTTNAVALMNAQPLDCASSIIIIEVDTRKSIFTEDIKNEDALHGRTSR